MFSKAKEKPPPLLASSHPENHRRQREAGDAETNCDSSRPQREKIMKMRHKFVTETVSFQVRHFGAKIFRSQAKFILQRASERAHSAKANFQSRVTGARAHAMSDGGPPPGADNGTTPPRPCKAAAPKGPAFCFSNYYRGAKDRRDRSQRSSRQGRLEHRQQGQNRHHQTQRKVATEATPVVRGLAISIVRGCTTTATRDQQRNTRRTKRQTT